MHDHHHHGHHNHHQMMLDDFKKRSIISLILTLPVLILTPMIREMMGIDIFISITLDNLILILLSTIIYFYGGWPFLTGLTSELKKYNPGMMTLIGLAITVAYVYSVLTIRDPNAKPLFWELATLIDIMLIGHWIEMRSIMGASQSLEELAKLIPDLANLLNANQTTTSIPVSELKAGDLILVKPGEKIPADGLNIKGESSVNESLLTGESKPVHKSEGATVIAGAINGEGSLVVKVARTGEQSFLGGVIKLVREAQNSKSRTQDIANRAAFWLTLIAVGVGSATFIVWAFSPSSSIAYAVERMVSVMVITCPHALGLAVPLVVAMSTSLAAQHGLLIRDRSAFEFARKVNAVIFDKTGTLTKGEFGVTDILVLDDDYSQAQIINYAAAIEQESQHPIARGILKEQTERWAVENFKSITGKGAQGTVKGQAVSIVSPTFLIEENIDFDRAEFNLLSSQAKTIVFVLLAGKPIGAIALADIIRPESKEAIRRLKAMGVKTMMLTGDNRQVADWVAKEIGLDEVFAEVLPQDKVAKIKNIQAQGYIVAMAGDGVNDAPALAQADVGIAIGAGTDVAIETADIILVKSNPLDMVDIIGLAQNTYRKMIQNLFWATGYNAFAIPAAAGVFLSYGFVVSPAIGAVFMSLSTIVCAINARLLKY